MKSKINCFKTNFKYGCGLKNTKFRRILKRNYSKCDGSAGRDSEKQPAGFITLDNMNKNIKIMEYAVRGPLLIRASEIEMELKSGAKKPFSQVIKANVGDSQAMGQKPITFYRQVLALVTYPELLTKSDFPADTVERAKQLLSECRGKSVGSYSESFGVGLIRKHCAEFIKKRDGFPAKWEDIMLSNGASDSIKSVIKLMNEKVGGKRPGIMVPVPQYPLYSATLAEFDMHLIKYFLKEEDGWGLDINELKRSLCEAKEHCFPRALAVINPGNPTGQVLSKENIQEIIKFAYENKLVLLADEVYQKNIYSKEREFHSLKKIANEMGKPYNGMELASFMSCSKGYMGECGFRGGFCEMCNFNKDVMANFTKCISARLCPTVIGQCLVDCVVNPPLPGEPSFQKYACEKEEILNNLKTKAKMVHGFFNSVKGFSCNKVQGAMYAFVKIDIPPKAIEAAKAKNLPPDTFYAFELLESTGICVIPGSGFKQVPGTYHFRTTILPPVDELKNMLESLKTFQKSFMEKYT